MPVDGLPITLECLLNAAVTEMSLTSFKVEGRGKQTVVILRFTEDNVNRHFQAKPVQEYSTAYRRKSPSTRLRDQNRAEAYRNNQKEKKEVKEKGDSLSPSGLFLPTPPTLVSSQSPLDKDRPMYATDILSCGNQSSARPMVKQQEEEQQIDLTFSDTDTQTVTLYNLEQKDSCEGEIHQDNDGMEWGEADSDKAYSSKPLQEELSAEENERLMVQVQKLADTVDRIVTPSRGDRGATSGSADAAEKPPDDDVS